MSNPYFRFKQFTVFHDKCAMKVGIDGVLLGVWAPIGDAKNLLDIGTGTGLIALMLAQRSSAMITAIDIDQDAVYQAGQNVLNSPWKDRVAVQRSSLQEFAANEADTFDLIVSNPPYFVNSLKNPDKNRTTARHTDSLPHEELINDSLKLLSAEGRLCIILPVNEGLQCVDFALSKGLFCSKLVKVFPKPGVTAKRLLLEFGFTKADTVVSELVIETEERHHYSTEFSVLAKDFYLKL